MLHDKNGFSAQRYANLLRQLHQLERQAAEQRKRSTELRTRSDSLRSEWSRRFDASRFTKALADARQARSHGKTPSESERRQPD